MGAKIVKMIMCDVKDCLNPAVMQCKGCHRDVCEKHSTTLTSGGSCPDIKFYICWRCAHELEHKHEYRKFYELNNGDRLPPPKDAFPAHIDKLLEEVNYQLPLTIHFCPQCGFQIASRKQETD